jgi:hypothetical protein
MCKRCKIEEVESRDRCRESENVAGNLMIAQFQVDFALYNHYPSVHQLGTPHYHSLPNITFILNLFFLNSFSI